MTALEQIVLPLAESRALAEKVKLDTAMVWVYVKDANGKIVLTVMPRRDAAAACLGADCDGQKIICGAPALSELLDAIRERCPGNLGFCHFEYVNGKKVWQVWWGESELLSTGQAHGEGDSYLLAACALLLEVAK